MYLELAPIGWQVFARGFSLRDQPASSLPFGTFATRLLAQPLRQGENILLAGQRVREGGEQPEHYGADNSQTDPESRSLSRSHGRSLRRLALLLRSRTDRNTHGATPLSLRLSRRVLTDGLALRSRLARSLVLATELQPCGRERAARLGAL